MNQNRLADILSPNPYPGRGIVIGKSTDGKSALFAYFIMGRSVNSRNRIFERFENGLRTKAFDESKMTDPSLIIYHPYWQLPLADIVTNGDQTDTIVQVLNTEKDEFSFEKALLTREFEPDAPNFTPRISGMLNYCFDKKTFNYKLSVIKSAEKTGKMGSNRFFYRYTPINGFGHLIHTYQTDGNPIPPFCGEPEMVAMPNTVNELADLIWQNLNADNKVSLFVRQIPLDGSAPTEIIINKNIGG